MAAENILNKEFFIFFGCWNQGYCDLSNPNASPLSSVILDIKNNLEDKSWEQRPELLIVAGDNYYPTKESKKGGSAAYEDTLNIWRPNQPIPEIKKKSKDKSNDKPKKKIFKSNFLHSGMNCIRTLNKYFTDGIYMLMGNHDLQYEKFLQLENGTPVPGCEIIVAQMAENYPEEFNYKEYYKKSSNTLFLFVNSSMYTSEGGDDKDGSDIFECMKEYRPKIYADAQNILDIMNIDEGIIDGILGNESIITGINNVIICGHEPIVEIKKKGLEPVGTVIRGIGNTDSRGLRFFKSIYDKFDSTVDKFYLCADVHNYQEGTIIFADDTVVKQYVVGTGGTGLDIYDYDQRYSVKETDAEGTDVYQRDNVDADSKYSEYFEPPTGEPSDEQLGLTFTLDNYMLEFGYLRCTIENFISDGSGSEEIKEVEEISNLQFTFEPVIYNGCDNTNPSKQTPMGGCIKVDERNADEVGMAAWLDEEEEKGAAGGKKSLRKKRKLTKKPKSKRKRKTKKRLKKRSLKR